jgi:hypothetical protein
VYLENKTSQISGILHLTYLQKYKFTNNLINNNLENVEIFSFKRENQFPTYLKSVQMLNSPLSELIKKKEESPTIYLKSFYKRIVRRILRSINYKSKTKTASDYQKYEMERVYEKNIADNIKMLFENDTLKKNVDEKNSREGKTIKNLLKNLTVNLFTHKM